MLRHYIKMAMRHLLKNKIQNLISIVGLSVGILCFSICLYCSRFISEVDSCIIRKSKFPQNPKRSVRFSGKGTKRSVQKRKARNTQKAETKVL